METQEFPLTPEWVAPKECFYCRFWKRKQREFGYTTVEKTEVAQCLHPALKAPHEWPFKTETATGNGDSQGIETGAEFGCVHWEKQQHALR